ncbi:DsbA family protein [Streptomyces sp. NRRL S-1831]|uniref:DsbA family protein n=1 Tax=Streptomyces sp. NRRL S-1831 TaxID=1463890 RepID=UPI0004C6FAB0|nr:DsbA family protein [Streptomyces sp. NRRL S-1831]
MKPRRRPRAYFNLRSPYSWMALDQLERRFPRAGELIDYYPLWEPEAGLREALHERGAEVLYRPMSKAKHLYILSDVKRTATRLGYPLAWPVDSEQDWDLPHLAWLAARREGRHRPLYRALVETRWHRGEPINSPEAVVGAGEAAGLDGAALLAAARSPQVRAEAVDVLEAAYEDDIFGMPYFRIGRERLWGLDRLDEFVSALHRAWPEAEADVPARTDGLAADADPLAGVPAELLTKAGSYDTDTAGACG